MVKMPFNSRILILIQITTKISFSHLLLIVTRHPTLQNFHQNSLATSSVIPSSCPRTNRQNITMADVIMASRSVLLETQLSLTNRATHFCKCNDVTDLTSFIKIHLKNWFLTSGLSRSLKVIGTDTNRPAIYDFLLVFSSNFVTKTHRFRDIRLQKCCDLEVRVRGQSR